MAKKGKKKQPAERKGQEEAPVAVRPAPDQTRKALMASFVGWIIPGGGHFYLGRRGRASLLFAAVALLLILGIVLDGQIYRARKDQPLTVLASFASMGNGPVHFLLRQSPWTSGGRGDNRSPHYEFGNTFILVAGLLNMLIILDAYDVGAGYKP